MSDKEVNKKESRKQMLLSYKERKITGGVCQIVNTINGKRLLLSGANLKGLQNRFEFSTKTNSCTHIKLQKDWNTYGADSFSFAILEEIEKKEEQSMEEFNEDLKVLEELWLDKFKPDELY